MGVVGCFLIDAVLTADRLVTGRCYSSSGCFDLCQYRLTAAAEITDVTLV
jgi:hypothetical protein